MNKNKIIVNFSPTGMVPTRDITPHVPISPQEIIEQTHEAYEVGITIAHLHAREIDGIPSWKPEIYQEIFEGVRNFCPDLIICGSTSGRNFPEFEKRASVIELRPDMCSLTLSSLNFIKQASVNDPEMIKRLAQKMEENGVVPELECFDLGMVNYGKYLINKGLAKGPYYWNLLFGNIAGFQASFTQIGAALNEIPRDHFVSLAGLGADQLPVNSMAIAMGYGARVGIEDNIWWDEKRTRHATNIELIRRTHEMIKLNQKEFFTPKELGNLGFYNRKKNE